MQKSGQKKLFLKKARNILQDLSSKKRNLVHSVLRI